MSFPAKLEEWGAISFNPANPPTVNWAYGCFPTAVPTRNGAGDYQFALATEYPIDSTQVVVAVQQNLAAAASGLTCFGWTDTSDSSKRLTILQEAAMGAASALTDTAGPVVVVLRKRNLQS